MTVGRLSTRINHLNSDGFLPTPASILAEQTGIDGFMPATAGWVKPIAPPRFMPATGRAYESTIHTFQLKGSDGREYNVVLDLVRNEGRLALRVAVVDAETGKPVASKFADLPRAEFAKKVGALEAMDGKGHFAFAAADGSMKFDFTATLAPRSLVQGMSDKFKAAIEKQLASVPEEQRDAARAKLPLSLSVTDYPLTTHTGSMTVKVGGAALTLSAKGTPSTISHHHGEKAADYAFFSSVPRPGAPRVTAVVSKVGADAFGYIIRTDASGRSTVALLTPEAWTNASGTFAAVELQVKHEAGAVAQSGTLPSKTSFATVTVTDLRVLMALGLSGPERFEDVVVDVTGGFLR
jgi:hypothetical protein